MVAEQSWVALLVRCRQRSLFNQPARGAATATDAYTTNRCSLNVSSRAAESVQDADRSDKRSALARLVNRLELSQMVRSKRYAGELDAVEAEQTKARVNSDMRPETAERSVALCTSFPDLRMTSNGGVVGREAFLQRRSQRFRRTMQNGDVQLKQLRMPSDATWLHSSNCEAL